MREQPTYFCGVTRVHQYQGQKDRRGSSLPTSVVLLGYISIRGRKIGEGAAYLLLWCYLGTSVSGAERLGEGAAYLLLWCYLGTSVSGAER